MMGDGSLGVTGRSRSGAHARAGINRRRWRGGIVVLSVLVIVLLAGGYSIFGTDSSKPVKDTIRVLMVGNPQMLDIQRLTPKYFTKKTGIKVEYTILTENELRDQVTKDISAQTGRYDVVTVGAYEVPLWAEKGWLRELSTPAEKDVEFDKRDLLRPIVQSLSGSDGQLYGIPFYGESSVLMYRTDLFERAGLTMPENPTWKQVESFARKLDDKSSGVAGICLRGLPGWGEALAPLTTVVNTFGGTWFTADWKAKVNAPEFTEAVSFYVNLVRKYGEPHAARSGYTECLNLFRSGKAAMWYDATAAAATLEDPKASKVAGKVGYVFAPTYKTEHSGWLWSWAWAVPKTTKHFASAWEFISWASGKEYEQQVGEELGWSRIPDGKRESTYYQIQGFALAAAPYYQITLASIASADPENPGLQKRPALGVQFVGIPEFAELGNDVSQRFALMFDGKITVEEALDYAQKRAEKVAAKYRRGEGGR